MTEDSIDTTVLLTRAAADDRHARSELIALHYDRLCQQAHRLLRSERTGHSLEAADLAHEAVLRILRGNELSKAKDCNQLVRACARALRQALIDHVRLRKAVKRGGNCAREGLDDFEVDVRRQCGGDAEDVSEALGCLAEELPREATVLEMRFFGGFTLPEIAAALELSPRTVERDCRSALTWLRAYFAQEAVDAT